MLLENKVPIYIRPYQVWLYKVPNQHINDPENPKFRPIIILETYVSDEDIESNDVDLNDIYPDYVIGTSKVDKYKDELNSILIDKNRISSFFLHYPTVFRFNKFNVGYNPDLSYNDILRNGIYLGTLSKNSQQFLRSNVNIDYYLPEIRDKTLDERRECIMNYNKNKIREEFIDDAKKIYTTESVYDVTNRIKNSNNSIRILWDKNINRYFICSVDDYIHRDMVEIALELGFYGDMPRYELDNYLDDTSNNVEYFIYVPLGLESQTYGADLGEDSYEGKYLYPFGSIVTRSDDTYKYSDLYKALGKYENHFYIYGYDEEGNYIIKSDRDTNLLDEAKDDFEKFKTWLGNDKIFDLFIKLKPRLKSPYNDIYYWMKDSTPEKLETYLDDLSKVKTKKEKDEEASSGAELVAENNYYKVYHITSFKASQKYGKGTKWCITGNNGEGQRYWNDYTNKGIQFYFYIPKDSKHDKYALALSSDKSRYEIYDSADEESTYILDAPKTSFYEPSKVVKDFILSKDEKTLVSYAGKKSELTPEDFPENVTIIGEGCFENNRLLTLVSLPSTIVEIDSNAFSSCENLKSIQIPYGVKAVNGFAFAWCTSLTSITIPNSVIFIGNYAFSSCTSLKSIKIPSSVTSINIGVFSRCSSLTSIDISNGVTSIDWYAFEICTSLESIEIPNSVKYIEDYAFSGCTSLKSIKIPYGVTTVNDFAFSSCTSLKSVTISNSVTSIGSFAFEKCSSLTSIYIPSSVKYIEDYAFSDCIDLTVYCEVANKPTGWKQDWYKDAEKVVWDYKDSLQEQDDSTTSNISKIKYKSIDDMLNDSSIKDVMKLLEEQSIKEGLQVSSFNNSGHAYVLFPDGKLFDVSRYDIHLYWLISMITSQDLLDDEFGELEDVDDEDPFSELLDSIEFQGLITLNTGKSDYESRAKITIGYNVTSAQYPKIEDFLYSIYYDTQSVIVYKCAKYSMASASKTFDFGDYLPEDIIDSIKNSFRSDGVLETKDEHTKHELYVVKEDKNTVYDSLGNVLSEDVVELLKNSKIRNKNGQILVVYHGTTEKFNDSKFINKINWFTTSKDYASEFASILGTSGYIYDCYLNCEKPLIIGNTNTSCYLPLPINMKPYKFSESSLNLIKKLNLNEDEARELFDSVAEEYDFKDGGYKMHLHVVTRSSKFAELAIKKGYDCVVTKESGNLCFGVFNESDIYIIDK